MYIFLVYLPYSKGVGRAELVKRVRWLKEAIESRDGRVADFEGMDLEHVVTRFVLSILGLSFLLTGLQYIEH